jgi:threonyl-tRNA synthetase
LLGASVRAELNDSPEKIGAKIRKATMDKVPYMLVLGQREQESQTVAVRHRTEGDRGAFPFADFMAALLKDIQAKA